MKTYFKYGIFLVILFIGIAVVFSHCKKDTDCVAVITVKLLRDTNIVVPKAKVKLHYQDVKDSGIADDNGQVRFTYKLDAILKVDAILYKVDKDSLNVDSMNSYMQQTLIRLIPGKTNNKSVFIDTLHH